MAVIGNSLQKSIEELTNGNIIGIPTETVYGLAANALNPDAILKIFEAKKRPHFDPLIVHTHSLLEVEKYVTHIPEKARLLANKFWPGPLTLVLPKKSIIPDLVTSGLDTVGVRIPNHPLTLTLLQQLDFPLAAPSANPFGYISPTTAQHVEAQLGEAIPYILDGGECKVGVESTIVAFEGDCVIIMRLGGTSVEDIETLIGKVELRINASSNPASPGQLLSHYSPKKIFLLGDIEKMLIENEDKKVAIISFNKKYEAENILSNKILSPNRNMHEAAKNLFHFMRLADASTVDLILAEEVPDIGLGMAINDRLRRAAFI